MIIITMGNQQSRHDERPIRRRLGRYYEYYYRHPFWGYYLSQSHDLHEQELEERVNFSLIGHALFRIGSPILRQVLESFVKPQKIVDIVQRAYPELLQSLNQLQKDVLSRASIDGYRCFDVDICYILLRYICTRIGNLTAPSHGWGLSPNEDDKTVSADIERIRKLNDDVHGNLERLSIPTTQFEANWGQLHKICRRMNAHYPEGKDFTQELNRLEDSELSDSEEESMIERLRKSNEQRESLKNLLAPVQDVPCKTGRHMKEHVVIRYDTKLPENRITHEVHEGIAIIKKNPYFVSDEAILASNLNLSGRSGKRSIPASDLENIKECIRANAEDLWKKHSNLTIITGDSIKSVNRKNVPKTCIVLYCLSKGFIPINEEPFPKELSCIFGKFETDVREGYFTLGPTRKYGVLDAYNDPICMGSSIGSNWRDVSGSLGLFVDLPQNEMGFITCCHVLFDCIKPYVFHYQKEATSAPRYVVQPGNTSLCGREYDERECGEIVKAKFDPCSSQISVDVALVKISKRKPTTGHFVIKDTTQSKELGFTKDELPVFDKGEVRRNIRPTDHDKLLLKSGTSTGLTRSLFRMDGAQVRIFQEGAWLGSKDQRDVIMKGQIEVEGGIINKTFFEPGDSGSAVFIKEPDGQLACIGIAIGKTSYGTTVVTPIGSVLDALGLKDSDVTKFS